MKKIITLFLFFAFSLPFFSQAQDTTTVAANSTNVTFLDFVKKVYFNPTILIKTQTFKNAHQVQIQILPSNSDQSPQSIKGFEKAMQKIIRFLISSGNEGIVRFYFNPNHPQNPFSFVASEELHCKFSTTDIDSITTRLNKAFKTNAIDYNNSALFEGAIQAGLDYTSTCLNKNRGKCGPKTDNEIKEINTKPLYTTIHRGAGSKYDIDTMQFDAYSSYYTEVYDLHRQKNVFVPAKLFIAGESAEPLTIAIHKREPLILKQNFKVVYMATKQVMELEASSTIDSLKIVLPANLPANQVAEYGIYYKSTVDSLEYLVGSFSVHVYTEKKINLHLVSVDNAPIDEAQILSSLQKIYGPVGVKFTIQPSKNIAPEASWATSITMDNSSLLSSYTQELRDYVGAVKNLNDYSKNDYFLVLGLNSESNYSGYMPRKSNIGFIFSNATNKGDVIAHEIGHGAFHLRHIFDEEELGENAKGTTKNLMDYVVNPLDLYTSQWEGIDDPVAVGWFEGDDEDGAAKAFGLVAYYFWNEKEGGEFIYAKGQKIHSEIIDNKITLAYKRNTVALFKEGSKYSSNSVLLANLKKGVNECINEGVDIMDHSQYEEVEHILHLDTYEAKKLQSVIYYTSHLGRWESVARPPVIYFNYVKNRNGYDRVYSHCSDSIILPKHGVKILANTHVIVKIFKKADGKTTDFYQLYDFSGKDITDQIINKEQRAGERYLIYANGYRGADKNWDVTDGLVTETDRFYYWPTIMKKSFGSRLKPAKTFYIDGSDRITTTNHLFMGKFAISYLEIREEYCEKNPMCSLLLPISSLIDEPFEPSDPYKMLNDEPNVGGFNERKEKGKLAAQTFLASLSNKSLIPGQKDTIDIVCHSMGYAYSLGFIEYLKDKVIWGRMYILAPENASSGAADWSKFEEVWQYGSNNNEDDPDRDPFWLQDGVAPQSAVPNLEVLPPERAGRAYIPPTFHVNDGKLGQFDGRHSQYNYMWIFNNIKAEENGYVKPR